MFRLHLDKKYSFEEAYFACQVEESDLLELRSRVEYNHVMERIKGFNVWLGIKVCMNLRHGNIIFSFRFYREILWDFGAGFPLRRKQHFLTGTGDTCSRSVLMIIFPLI